MEMKPIYKRVLLKLSGEALAGQSGRGIDFELTKQVCLAIKKCVLLGVQVGIVVGSGNFWRGVKDGGDKMVRARADYMGMLGTAMNSLALLDVFERLGVNAEVQSAIAIERIASTFNRDEAVKSLEQGKVVIFACGTGEPYFTTDTAGTLRALEIGADALLLAKNIDGIYSADPRKDDNAVKFKKITYEEVMARRLEVMDSTANALAMDNKLPVIVFALKDTENIVKAVMGEDIGTTVY
jgi:uridylate kinase